MPQGLGLDATSRAACCAWEQHQVPVSPLPSPRHDWTLDLALVTSAAVSPAPVPVLSTRLCLCVSAWHTRPLWVHPLAFLLSTSLGPRARPCVPCARADAAAGRCSTRPSAGHSGLLGCVACGGRGAGLPGVCVPGPRAEAVPRSAGFREERLPRAPRLGSAWHPPTARAPASAGLGVGFFPLLTRVSLLCPGRGFCGRCVCVAGTFPHFHVLRGTF